MSLPQNTEWQIVDGPCDHPLLHHLLHHFHCIFIGWWVILLCRCLLRRFCLEEECAKYPKYGDFSLSHSEPQISSTYLEFLSFVVTILFIENVGEERPFPPTDLRFSGGTLQITRTEDGLTRETETSLLTRAPHLAAEAFRDE